MVDQELGATSMRLRTAGVTQPTQHSPRSFQRGPKCLGAQMHRALLARHKHRAIFATPNVIYLPLGLFGKVNSEVSAHRTPCKEFAVCEDLPEMEVS
jgi:hypothetical protein